MRNSSIKAMMENELRKSSRDPELTVEVEFIASNTSGVELYKCTSSNRTNYAVEVKMTGFDETLDDIHRIG